MTTRYVMKCLVLKTFLWLFSLQIIRVKSETSPDQDYEDYLAYSDSYENNYENYEKDKEEDPLENLKRKLQMNKSHFRSTKEKKKFSKASLRMNAMVVSSIYSKNNVITTCPPKSLQPWLESNKNKYKLKRSCLVNIQEVPMETHHWKNLHWKLMNDSNTKKYKKGIRPPTLSMEFRNASSLFAVKYLAKVKKYNDLLATIMFLEHHPQVNKQLLDYAITKTLLKRKDTSLDVPNPIEVDDVFFKKKKTNKEEDGKAGSDYTLFIPSGGHILAEADKKLSHDPVDTTWDYWREDSLLHVFHSLLHKVWDAIKWDGRFSRTFELFFYTHQQLLRRAAIEREIAGLSEVRPLDPAAMRSALGPGYTAGWYAWQGLPGRIDRCRLEQRDPSELDRLEAVHGEVMKVMQAEDNYEAFLGFLETEYHPIGHLVVSQACSQDRAFGIMAFSEVSARDPIFYRWHSHIEDICQLYRDRMPSYTKADFTLSDGVSVGRVRTLIRARDAGTRKHLENILITHNEKADIVQDEATKINYDRLNHIPFTYQISIKNPRKVRKKVIVRLWLGLSSDDKDMRVVPKRMVEMDRFVVRLKRRASQTLVRRSGQSLATMKEMGGTLEKLMDDIQRKEETETWCGFPHNLLLPKSKPFDPDREDGGGKNFVLFAFVNDVGENVTEGVDGIEHMMCGHRRLMEIRHDKRPFGFPFDRNIGFKLEDNSLNFLHGTFVKIYHRPETVPLSDLAKHLEETPSTTTTTTTTTAKAKTMKTTTTMDISEIWKKSFQDLLASFNMHAS